MGRDFSPDDEREPLYPQTENAPLGRGGSHQADPTHPAAHGLNGFRPPIYVTQEVGTKPQSGATK